MKTSSPRAHWAFARQTLIASLTTAVFMFLLTAGALAGTPTPGLQSTPHHAKALAARASRRVPRSLALASRLGIQADHALVSAANSLEACLGEGPSRKRHCNVYRRAVQRAGNRLAAAEQRLSRIADTTGKAARAGAPGRTAPRLTVSGRTLSWTKVGKAHVYLLMTQVPAQAAHYSVLTGTSFAPPPVPGATVRYSVRTATYWSAWSPEQSITYEASGKPSPTVPRPSEGPPGQHVDTQAAPTVTVTGQTLTWSAVGNLRTYVLHTSIPGRASQYSEVTGTTVTPPAVPGARVQYQLRTAVDGSAWSTVAVITYPRTEPTPPPQPPTEPKPAQEFGTSFQPGLNSGTTMNLDLPGSVKLGAKLVRLEFWINEPTAQMESTIGQYAAAGIRVLPMAGFAGTMPSPAEAQHLATWAAAFGPGGSYWASHPGNQEPFQSIEFGNETSYGYQYGDEAGSSSYRARAETYASRLKSAAEAISATGIRVGLLAQADDWTGNWVNGMYAAVPNLSNYVAGWTIHPYGPTWKGRVEDLIKQTAAHGAPSTIPIDITEWGISTDNGRCLSQNYGWNPCMSYQEAAEALTSSAGEMRQMLGARLQDFLLYKVRDLQDTGVSSDREDYFGALQRELQPKGAFTLAVQNLLAS